MIVWLASYPRSGNTFVRILFHAAFGLETYSLYGDLLDISKDEKTSLITGHKALPSNWSIEAAKADNRCWLVKTHDHPLDDSMAIYILRDGREVAISFWEYLNQYTDYDYSLGAVAAGFCPFGSWSDHVNAWDPLNRKNTLLIKFEEMVEKPTETIDALGKFLNITPTQKNIPSFNSLHEINPKFFRSGVARSWKSKMDPDIQAGYQMIHGNVLKAFGYPVLDSSISPEPLIQMIKDASNQREMHRKFELERLEHLAHQKNEEIKNLQALTTHQNKILDIKNKDLVNLQEKNNAQENLIVKKNSEIKSLEKSIETHKEKIKSLEKSVKIFEEKVQNLDQEIRVSQSIIQTMEQSISWKITSPLRRIRRFFPK